ncbi:MAG: hypothetical protein LAN63_07355 [Acidobacteriia bacterium]|nr:hypothetical protein [Terriglobia bacterium]
MKDRKSAPSFGNLLERMRRRPTLTTPPLLYHYTQRAAVEGIISSKSLWATEARLLEDPFEIRYGFELAQEILTDELRQAKSIGKKSMQACLEVGLAEMNLVNDCSADAYVACFCAKPNHEPQYNKFGPYQIEFDLSPLQGAFPLRSTATCRYLRLEQVLYEPDLQRQRLRRVLQRVRETTEEFENLGIAFLCDSLLEQALTPWIYVVKRPIFAEEHEWRVVFLPKMDDWWSRYETSTGMNTKLNNRGQQVRYVELASNGSTLPMKSITCGPGSDPDFQAEQIRRLLSEHCFGDVSTE